MRTLPTERLANVLTEATEILTQHNAARRAISQILRDAGVMPLEAIIAELREVLDNSNVSSTSHIQEAVAYLKVNKNRLDNARNADRKRRGLEPRDATINLPEREEAFPIPASNPVFSIEDIEEKLAALEIES